ncbi:histidine kinase [Niabella pedocola]|uniref:histidine kinase n=1 Tax=Niabella pedocola TaxID=1752077 RepID=A0ABS8PLE0_9BACT|nr:histidine kinase [Niabella pedocola]MCD2421816.1 histidine kinase [Niabella pedocola]
MNSVTDAQKLSTLLDLLDQRESLSVDTLSGYIRQAKMLNQIKNDQKTGSKLVLAEVHLYIRQGKLKEARETIEVELKKYPRVTPSNKALYFKLYEAKIDCVNYSDHYQEASAIAYKIIKEAELYNDSIAIGNAYNSLACWNYDLDFTNKAIQYSYEALSWTSPTPAFYNLLAGIYLNLGEEYWWIDKLDSAEFCIRKGIAYSIKNENLNFQYYGLQKMGSIKTAKKEFEAAERSVLQSFEIYKKLNGSIPSNRNLMALGNIYMNWDKPDKAIAVLTEGLRQDSIYEKEHHLSLDSNRTDIQKMYVHNLLAKCYKKKADYQNYALELEKIITEKDRFYKVNAAETLADLQTKYEVQKKETTIANQNLMLARRQNVIIGISAAILLLVAAVFVLFKDYRKKQIQKSKTAIKDAEEKERKRIAADLHDNLGVQANVILYTSELLKQAQRINDTNLVAHMNETAKDMLFFLRETLWALKTTDTTAQQLWLRILNFMGQMKRSYPGITFLTTGNVTRDFVIAPATALNILMIIQEASNNSIRHSRATEIIITSTTESDHWKIVLHDNGIGFNPAVAQKEESNGLKNMEQRAAASGIRLVISSNASKGTEISLSV